MKVAETDSKVDRLAAVLRDRGADVYLARSPISMGYLHGVWENAGERFMTLAVRSDGQCRLIAPALSETQARRAGVDRIDAWSDGQDPLELFERLARDWDLEAAVIAVDDDMPAQMLLKVQAALPAALFRPGGELIGSLMSRKNERELALMRQAGQIADRAFREVAPGIRPGLTETEVSRQLELAMERFGGRPTFSIVAAGPNGAEPHHLSDHTEIKWGDVLVLDFGCEVENYQSDITRTISIGDPEPEAGVVYELVYRAHMAARSSIRPGVLPEEVDARARQVIEAGGYGSMFFHRTGHGIGLQVHEAPNIVAGNRLPLEIGNCFSIEPGVYLSGRFGVRVENIVTVVEAGHESLNEDPSPHILSWCGPGPG